MSTKSILINNKAIKINNKAVTANFGIDIPEDTDFIYFANDYITGEGIPNKVTNSDMGMYIDNNKDLTKNESGDACYLTHEDSDDSRLQIELTDKRLNAMKAESNTYTYFIRVYKSEDSSGIIYTGGIFSWRTMGGGYNYMIRCENNYIDIHGGSGTNTIELVDGNVIKVEINSQEGTAIVLDLDNGNTQTVDIGTDRDMGNLMTTFYAGEDGEHYLDKVYGLAGIHRSTTKSEDDWFKQILHNQSL